jgi:acyl carrier protein
MTTTTTNIATALETIVRRFAPKDRAALTFTRETRLVDEAGIDSPRMIDLTLGVEDTFRITVEDDDIGRVATFGDLVDLVAMRMQEAG